MFFALSVDSFTFCQLCPSFSSLAIIPHFFISVPQKYLTNTWTGSLHSGRSSKTQSSNVRSLSSSSPKILFLLFWVRQIMKIISVKQFGSVWSCNNFYGTTLGGPLFTYFFLQSSFFGLVLIFLGKISFFV